MQLPHVFIAFFMCGQAFPHVFITFLAPPSLLLSPLGPDMQLPHVFIAFFMRDQPFPHVFSTVWHALGVSWGLLFEMLVGLWSFLGIHWVQNGARNIKMRVSKAILAQVEVARGSHRLSMDRFWGDVHHLVCAIWYFGMFLVSKVLCIVVAASHGAALTTSNTLRKVAAMRRCNHDAQNLAYQKHTEIRNSTEQMMNIFPKSTH